MKKKIVASALGVALLAGQSAAVTAAPVSRLAAPVEESEGVIGTAWIALIFAAVAAGVIVAIEEGEDDAPVSP